MSCELCRKIMCPLSELPPRLRAGKSTITDLLIGKLKKEGKKISVLCVDPSSPFSKGALLGDRVRMNKWYNDANVFIRSFATRVHSAAYILKLLK